MKTRYIALLDGSDGAYGVVFPDAPGCTAMGATVDEALQNAREALAEWVAHSEQEKLDRIAPRSADEIVKAPEVKEALSEGAILMVIPLILERGKPVRANLSLDAGLLDAIDEAAAAAGLTRSAFLASAARQKIEEAA